MTKFGYALIGIIVLILLGAGYFFFTYKSTSIPEDKPIDTEEDSLPLTLPDSFQISVFAKDLPGARVMAFDPKGAILVSQTSEGKITALPFGSDGKAGEAKVVIDNLNKPHGMTFRCLDVDNPTKCEFYIAEENALSLYDYDENTKKATNRRKLLDLPTSGGGGHFTRTIIFLASPNENTLLISVGSSCNVCNEDEERGATILSYNVVTKKSEIYAKGLRNSVFMELHPVSGQVYATEMGRDGLGDDIPPDEINVIEKGRNYGWPTCYGKNIHDTDFDKNTYIRNPCQEPLETKSFIDLQAHSAPLGLAFAPEEGWSEEYWFNMFVAFHGSWNRSEPTGYKVVRVKMNAKGEYLGIEDFITGWLRPDGTKFGRPVDIKILPGGTMFISDDGAGAVYKVTRK